MTLLLLLAVNNVFESRLGPPRLAFETPRGSRDPRLRTTGLERLYASGAFIGKGGNMRSGCVVCDSVCASVYL